MIAFSTHHLPNMLNQVLLPPGSSNPGNPPSAQDWEDYRTVITDLYRRYILRDVRSFMAHHHKFIASERMYRTRIKAWRLDKKLKDREARAVVRIVRRRRAEGSATPTFRLRGKDMSIADALTFLKRKGISGRDLECAADETGSQTPSDLSVVSGPFDARFKVEDVKSASQYPLAVFHYEQASRPPSTAPDLWHSCYLVSQISNYCQVHFSSTMGMNFSNPYGSNILAPRNVFHLFYWGFGLLLRQDATGWRLMQKSLKLLNSIFEQHEVSLLPLLLDLDQRITSFQRFDWRLKHAIEFLELLKGTSEAILGRWHPITLVCYSIVARELQTESLLHSYEIIAANFEKFRGKVDPMTRLARISLGRTLSSFVSFNEARGTWSSLISEWESLHEQDDLWIRACLIGQVASCLDRGDLANAHSALQDFCKRSRNALVLRNSELLPAKTETQWKLSQNMACVRRSQIRLGQGQAILEFARNYIPGDQQNDDITAAFGVFDECFNMHGQFDPKRSLKLYHQPMEQVELDLGLAPEVEASTRL